MTQRAHQKLRYYIEQCPQEISGLGFVRQRDSEEKNRMAFEIYDVTLLKQEVSGSHASIKPEDLARFAYEQMKAKGSMEDVKVWWHSHASFRAFFSGTDTGTIESSTEFPYLISLVGNHAGDIVYRLDVFKPWRFTVEGENIDFVVEQQENTRLLNQCVKEIGKKVTLSKGYAPSAADGTVRGYCYLCRINYEGTHAYPDGIEPAGSTPRTRGNGHYYTCNCHECQEYLRKLGTDIVNVEEDTENRRMGFDTRHSGVDPDDIDETLDDESGMTGTELAAMEDMYPGDWLHSRAFKHRRCRMVLGKGHSKEWDKHFNY